MIRIMGKGKSGQKELPNFIESIVVGIINKARTKLSMEEVLEIYGEQIDKFILATIKNENLRYISGSLTLTSLDDYVNTKVECYFQDQSMRWIKKESESNIERVRIKEETMHEKEMKFEIEHP